LLISNEYAGGQNESVDDADVKALDTSFFICANRTVVTLPVAVVGRKYT
jgi:hypothetical protein